MKETAAEKTFAFGTCDYAFVSPDRSKLTPKTKILNVVVSFEDALKLNLALDECIRKINRYKRSTTAGKRAAVNICLHLNSNRIAVSEGKLKK